MTATLPPRVHPSPVEDRGHGGGTVRSGAESAAHRTLLALLATAMGATPMLALLSDTTWLVDAWLTMIVVMAPAALLRLRRAPSALDVWPGIVLLIPWLTVVFVPHHAWGSFIPTRGSMHDLAALMDSLHRTIRDEVAPVHSTPAIRLVVSALFGLLAALVDLIAVVGRRGALAGVPLLVVFTVAGAVPRTPVPWAWFVLGAVGFLILLGLDAGDELRSWGRRIGRHGGESRRPALAVSAQRIGVLAIVVALAVPLLLPDHARNLIADAFHDGGHGGVGSFGAGTGGGAISPFVALKGQLDRNKPIHLATVHVDGPKRPVPFYLKTNVLDSYTDNVGWSVNTHGQTEPIERTDFGSPLTIDTTHVVNFSAQIDIDRLSGNVPVFTTPRSLSGVEEGTTWSGQDGLLLGSEVSKGQQIFETFAQPDPSIGLLRASPPVGDGELQRWLSLPDSLPRYVRNLVAKLTRGRTSPYDKARALSDFFADPANDFIYSLRTRPGDSGSLLVDFLKNREGYCQQYAAALAVMLRAAGVPSRVALGYMHPVPDGNGNFDVTTTDAHSWVEAYFLGIGWVPFDPTPAAALSGGQAADLKWAKHKFQTTSRDTKPHESTSPSPSSSSRNATQSAGPGTALQQSGDQSATADLWVLIGVLTVSAIALIPAGMRAARRRRRFVAARHGDADALWRELSDTAIDLGYVWSPARSPRQVSSWLAPDAGRSAPALAAIADTVERHRYGPRVQGPGETAGDTGDDTAGATAGLVPAVHDVAAALRAHRSRRTRLRATFWPASLGWGRRLGRWVPHPRHRRRR